MAVADLVVSKPGGLTTSETLARGAVMVIVNPIPGQESRNSDFLLENGAAIKVNNIGTLAYKIDSLLGRPARLARLKANVARLAAPLMRWWNDPCNCCLPLIRRSVVAVLDASAKLANRRLTLTS